MIILRASTILLLPSLAFAQNFTLTPSSSWRKPNMTTSLQQRISIAEAAIQVSINELSANAAFPNDAAFGTPGALFAEMAEFDIATNQTKYESQLLQLFQTVEANNPGFQNELCAIHLLFTNYALDYGYGAVRAYAAYKNPTFRNWAVTVWSFAQNYTISSSEATSTSSNVKSFPIESQCQGSTFTMAGGTFWNTDPTEPSIYCLGTGYFLITSALLAEATSNQTYLDAAQLAVSFIRSHLYNVDNIAQNYISARQNDSCSSSNVAYSYNSGLMIEGLAIIASLTNDSQTYSQLFDALTAAVTNPAWQGSDGVCINEVRASDDYVFLVRGLLAVYNRNPTNEALRNYLKQYLTVQYNAIVDQATIPDSNIYGPLWTGPPATTFQAENQTVSLMGLISSLYLVNDTEASTTNTTPNPTTPIGNGGDGSGDSSTSSSKVAPIVGGVVGGLAFIVILAGLVFILNKRKKRQQQMSELKPPEPFITQTTGTTRLPYAATTGSEITPSSVTPLSIPPSSVLNRREKRPLQTPTIQTSSASGSSQSPYFRPVPSESIVPPESSGGPAPGSENGPRGDQLPTSELVRLLNERLRTGPWDEDEELPPPEYPSTE